MAAKMAVYYKKYEKVLPETGKLQGICIQNAYFIDSSIANIVVVTSKWCYSWIIQILIY